MGLITTQYKKTQSIEIRVIQYNKKSINLIQHTIS